MDDLVLLLDDYSGDIRPYFQYTRALLAYRQSSPDADEIAKAAISSNRHIPGLLSKLVKRLKSISNENIEMASSSRNQTMLDYFYQARKYFVENKQNDTIHIYDRMFMQDLINGEHRRKPGLNITLVSTPEEFASGIDLLRIKQPDLYRGQFIVNMGEGIHYAALDVLSRTVMFPLLALNHQIWIVRGQQCYYSGYCPKYIINAPLPDWS